MANGKGGRPLDLTEEVIDSIVTFVQNGNSNKDAHTMAGISETTFYKYKQQGLKDIQDDVQSIFREFVEKLKKAESQFKAFHLQQIQKASVKGKCWQASAWLLERKFFNEFGQRQRLDIHGEVDVNKYDVPMTPEKQEAYNQKMKKLYPGAFKSD